MNLIKSIVTLIATPRPNKNIDRYINDIIYNIHFIILLFVIRYNPINIINTMIDILFNLSLFIILFISFLYIFLVNHEVCFCVIAFPLPYDIIIPQNERYVYSFFVKFNANI